MSKAKVKIKAKLREKEEFPRDFEKIVEECVKTKGNWGLLQNDILFAATVWLMKQSGFTAVALADNKMMNATEDMPLPKNWKHCTKQLYEAQFILPPYDENLVRLVALPADDILCINVLVSNVSPGGVSLKSLAVSSSGFVPRPEESQVLSKFSNLEYLRFHLRSTLIWPVRCAILTDQGIVNGSLSGLSDEIKLKIISLLDLPDLMALSETSHDLNRVCNDQGLWKVMFHRQFRNCCNCMGKSAECEETDTPWKENYKHFYKQKFAPKSSQHSSSDSFHTAAETTYYEVDFSYE